MLRHLAGALVVFAAPLAHADVQPEGSKCSDTNVDLAWTGTDFAEIGGDTGWIPNGFAAQIRLSGRVIGETAVASGVNAKACWDTGSMAGSLSPRAGTGFLDVAYGAELHARAKIDTSILGKAIYWEGELPIPYIPKDLLVGGQTTFDPWETDGRVSDATSPITLLSTDLIGDLIGIIGISGGLRIAVTPSMVTTYHAGTIHPFAISRPAGGYGSAIDVPLSVDGVVRYAPKLNFDLRFDVKILGVRVVDWTLFSIPMTLPALDRPITLTADAPAHLGLPVLDGIGEGARLDFSNSSSQELVIKNKGERQLVITPSIVPVGVTVQPLTIPAGRDGKLKVTADPDALSSSQTLSFVTNDPDQPELSIQVGVDIGGTDPGAVEEPESAGCHTGGGVVGWLFALGFVFVLRRRSR